LKLAWDIAASGLAFKKAARSARAKPGPMVLALESFPEACFYGIN